jgi:hypothetical protein
LTMTLLWPHSSRTWTSQTTCEWQQAAARCTDQLSRRRS